MLRSFLIGAVFMFIISLPVFSQGAYLQLSLYDDGDFYAVFDDKKIGEGNLAEFDNILPGEHYLKVVRIGINVPAQENVIFEGKIKIPAGDVYAVIDEYNSFLVYKKKQYGYNRCICNGEFIKRSGTGTNENNTEYVYDECRGRVMKKADFSDLKSSINNRSFESTNITIVKTAFETNYFTSEQVRELLGYFTFEANKLDIAKASYSRVCDKKNFFKVYDAFNFESSVDELKNYISGK